LPASEVVMKILMRIGGVVQESWWGAGRNNFCQSGQNRRRNRARTWMWWVNGHWPLTARAWIYQEAGGHINWLIRRIWPVFKSAAHCFFVTKMTHLLTELWLVIRNGFCLTMSDDQQSGPEPVSQLGSHLSETC
jgi:hypothetical protein